ncbi:MAG: DUF1700 domain-containing protein [Thermoflexaceae bacterium]|nr:DUF1700 domain-containing protein [Thermoflexaceae bacterium]
MNKEEYIQLLKKNLIHVSDAEKEDAIQYYTEYFEDAGTENEEAVIKELGNPVILARKIAAESAIKEIDEVRQERVSTKSSEVITETSGEIEKRGHDGIWKNLFVILLLLCSFPVWLPLSIVAVVLAFVLILVAGIFVFVVALTGGIGIVAGIAGILAGVAGLFGHLVHGITVMGAGLFVLGAGILLFIAGKCLVKALASLIVMLGRRKTSRM